MVEKKKIIILKPHLSEKSTVLRKNNQYVFDISPDTNKTEVKKMIEKDYQVKVKEVNIIHKPVKPKKWRRKITRKRKIKKAVVALKEGYKIDLGV